MNRRAMAAALLGGALGVHCGASAQTMQRCETPEGKVTYSNTTCPSGSEVVRTIEGDPGPTPAEQKAARERAQQHSRELDKLERQRQKEEEKAARTRAAADAKEARREAECRKLDAKVRAAREEFETATLSRRQALDRKLRLAEEQAAACRKS
jgi:molecular chaperone GrpE (heat shock protein)